MNTFWNDRRVAITGIAGFIGSHLAAALLARGADIFGLDRQGASPSMRVLGAGGVPILQRDVRNADRVAWALTHGNGQRQWRPPEVLFHLAGYSHIHDAQLDPVGAFEANVQGTWNILEACRSLPAGQIRAVVCASSNTVYGSLPVGRTVDGKSTVKQDFARSAWLEDDPPGDPLVYPTSKAMVDLLVRTYGRTYGLSIAALRHVNAGGEADPHLTHIIVATILSLLKGEPPVIRSDGTPIKAYLDVRDVVSAYLLLAERLFEGTITSGLAWNAAPAAPIPVLALVDLLIQISGLDLVPDIRGEDLSQSGSVEHLSASRLLAFGWSPENEYRAWLPRVYDWYKANGETAWLVRSA